MLEKKFYILLYDPFLVASSYGKSTVASPALTEANTVLAFVSRCLFIYMHVRLQRTRREGGGDVANVESDALVARLLVELDQ